MNHASDSYWNDPKQVERFASLEPDHRLMELVENAADPSAVKVLDLGCAAGRNTVLLLERGFQVTAVDASKAMVAHTRMRATRYLGKVEAKKRIFTSRMDDLGWSPDACFHWVVALGVFHAAESEPEFRRALSESARVLRPNGLLLVAIFSPATAPDGKRLTLVAGTRFVYSGHQAGLSCHLGPADLDAEMKRAGFAPEVETVEVRRELENGVRVTVNGLYRLSQSG